jgi:hypothetical protein
MRVVLKLISLYKRKQKVKETERIGEKRRLL